MYVSLHNHTTASNIKFLDCINRPKDMVKKAISLGFKGIAVTDHESLSSHVDFLKIKDSIKDCNPDFKIIFGNEIYLIDDGQYKNTNDFYHFILLAKDRVGYNQIRELSSRAWARSYVYKGIRRTPTFYTDIEEILGKDPGHIVASTACLGGELAKAILSKDADKLNKFITWCIKVFGRDSFFLEMQVSDSEEQVKCNKYIIKVSEHFGLKYIVTTDSHYLDKEDFKLFTSFLNSKSSSDRETEYFYKYTYMMSEQEMSDILATTGITYEQTAAAINNTYLIYNMIEDFDFRHGTIVPTIKIPEFQSLGVLKPYYEKYPIIKYMDESEYDQDRYMMYLIEKGLVDKHIIINDKIAARITEEIDVVKYISEQLNQRISAYLNLVKVIVDICWTISPVGVSRGSAGCFYINYLMDIVQMNPLDYDLPSFRFLNKARADALPDVDIDIDPNKNDAVVAALKEYFGHDNVINCATFKTEKLKSAVLNSARALGYNNDEAQAIAALVPQQRGIMYSLKDCLEGDEEKGLVPVPAFIDKLKSYEGLYEMVEKVEGLPTNASIHASALYIFNNGYDAQNSLMKAPNGTNITALNMHDSDDCGALKMDLLKTDAETKIGKAMDLLLRDNLIEWKGSLRDTYNYYLHPDKLDYNNVTMWELAADGKIPNLFQMETSVGQSAIKKMRPKTAEELATVNGLIRLTGGEGESPVDRYTRFKQDINLWYKEMKEYGLTDHEQELLRKHLDFTYGLCYNQEAFMLILMDPEIGGFTLKDADKGRKILAKKKVDDIAAFKEKFLTNTASTHEEFKQYVWDKMIAPQMQYSFNRGHGVGYSLIGLQEMNLATRWNPLYWACACLCVNSGNSDTNFEDSDEDYDESTSVEVVEEASDDKKEKSSAPNYIKIGKALCDAQHEGIKIGLPDINKSESDFLPDVSSNSILYSLKAITNVNDDLYERIVANRPYYKVSEFIEKVQPTTAQMVSLIKSGAFDNLMQKPRNYILRSYFVYCAKQSIQKKEKMTATQLKQAIELGMDLEKYQKNLRVYKFQKYIEKNQHDVANKRYLLNEEDCVKFFKVIILPNLKTDDYNVLPGGDIAVKCTVLNKIISTLTAPIMEYLSSPEGIDAFYNAQIENYVKGMEEKYSIGNQSAWEFQTMSFYHGPHELEGVKLLTDPILHFHNLPDNSDKCCYIAGTVIGAENGKHLVYLNTTSGVVAAKFYASNYILYNKKISVVDPDTKKKTVLDDSWFKKGNKVVIYGQRKENIFATKTDRSSGYNRTVGLIKAVGSNGVMDIAWTRQKQK